MFGKTAPDLKPGDVLEALRGVKDPEIHRDLVELGMVKDVKVENGTVSLTVNLTTPACPLKAQIEKDVRDALTSRLGQRWTYQINMSAEVRGKGVTEKGDIPGVKNVIAVGSGKGGVGKSTMAAAIAFGLKAYGASVGLMDADVYGPSIPHLVGSKTKPMIQGKRLIPVETDGLRLMSMGYILEPHSAVIMRGPMLHTIMTQFLRDVDWGELDYLVIDLPPGTGDVPLTLSQSLPLTGAVVVCTPQEVALLDAVRAVTMFRQLKVPVLGMIENMSFFDIQAYLDSIVSEKSRTVLASEFRENPGKEKVYIFGEGGARRKAESLNIPFLGEVPLNVLLRERGDQGRIIDALQYGSPSSPYLLGIVEKLAAQISIHNMSKPKLPTLEIIQ